MTADAYARDVTFEDPIIQYSGRDAYMWNIRALRAAFDVDYALNAIEVSEPSEIVARSGTCMGFCADCMSAGLVSLYCLMSP